MTQQPTVIWTEIPVSNLETSITFYNDIFGWSMVPMQMGAETVAAFGRGGIGGNLVEGPVGAGKGTVVHLMAPDGLEATMARARAAGAVLEGDVMEIVPGRYQVIHDPDGNRIGLFEPKAA